VVLHGVEVAAHCQSPSYLDVLAVVVKFLKYVGLVVIVCERRRRRRKIEIDREGEEGEREKWRRKKSASGSGEEVVESLRSCHAEKGRIKTNNN
jgi:hypothetical protein